MRATIKVLIVDDSALVRQMLARALSVDPRIEIVGTARTGFEAIERARELDPDIITLDIEMPDLSGLEALPYLRKQTRARILMLSTIDDPDTTLQALSSGAVDFIPKPREGFATSLSDLTELLLKKIHIAYRITPESIDGLQADARIEAITRERASDLSRAQGKGATGTHHTPRASKVESVVGIAASTGGPPALERVLGGLSASLPAAYLIVQHLPAGFSASLARRLSGASDVRVLEAFDGALVESATAYLAPHGAHMLLVGSLPATYRILLEDAPPVHGVKPAADPLFESIANRLRDRAVGVVLTGMGADGADGLASIKSAGGETIAQDEETSVVWGMPGAAVRIGAAQHIVPINMVAAEIRRVVRGSRVS